MIRMSSRLASRCVVSLIVAIASGGSAARPASAGAFGDWYSGWAMRHQVSSQTSKGFTNRSTKVISSGPSPLTRARQELARQQIIASAGAPIMLARAKQVFTRDRKSNVQSHTLTTKSIEHSNGRIVR